MIVIINKIFVHDGKGGGGDGLVHAKGFADSADERRLASSHLSVERYNTTITDCLDEFLGLRAHLLNILYNYFHFIFLF